jgi:TonB family protein
MASTEKIGSTPLTTLPADFSEWDAGDTPATLPDNFSGFDPVTDFSPVSRQPAQSLKSNVAEWTVVNRAPSAVSSILPNSHISDNTTSSQSYSNEYARNDSGIDSQGKAHGLSRFGTKMSIIAFGTILILTTSAALIYKGSRHKTAATAPSAIQTTHVTDSSKPSPATIEPEPQTTETSITQHPVMTTTVTTVAEVPSQHVNAEMMNSQLSEPSRISKDIKKPVQQDQTSSSNFGIASIDGIGGNSGSIGNVFGNRKTPDVKAEVPTKVNLPSAVAMKLIQKETNPIYPPIAKAARVSGSVLLQISISKAGTVESCHAISGPTMLLQAALDAVKTWHFKPYLLNNQPVEVDTTVNIKFHLSD